MSGPVSGADSAIRSARHRNRATAGSVLGASFRKRRSQLWRLGAWSAVEALPALLSGLLVALAVDEGFLAGRLTTGFTWLGVLAVSVVVGAWGTSQALRRLAAVVEPFRDELVSGVVTDALRRSTGLGGHPADGEVARLTQQVEIVREAYASVLIVVQQFVLNAVAPRVFGHTVQMHPLLVIAAAMSGATVAGVWGALFGIPVAGIGASIVKRYYTLRQQSEAGDLVAAEMAAPAPAVSPDEAVPTAVEPPVAGAEASIGRRGAR